MAEYRLLTIWRIEAPLADVYAAICNSPRWPRWWRGVETAEEVAAGNAEGIGSRWRYVWQGQLPYRVMFEACPTRIEAQQIIEGSTRGDLEGFGRWQFSQRGKVSTVSCYWHVHTMPWWMNLLSPFARPLFIRNHARIMMQGGQGLAHLLRAPLLSQESLDLTRISATNSNLHINLLPVVLMAGISAGVLATLAQLVLWCLLDIPLVATLLRDAHFTAAILMGSSVLPPPATAAWDVLLVASFIHFALSIAYAIPAALLIRREDATSAVLLIGALYGVGVYALNLYVFALFFPWFAATRDWITLAAHLVFGMSLTGLSRAYFCGYFRANSRLAPLVR